MKEINAVLIDEVRYKSLLKALISLKLQVIQNTKLLKEIRQEVKK